MLDDLPQLLKQENSEFDRDLLHKSERLGQQTIFDEKDACFSSFSDTTAQGVFVLSEAQVLATTPKTAREAVASAAAANWVAAMNREKACHEKNATFGEACLDSTSVKARPADWIFKIKHRGS